MLAIRIAIARLRALFRRDATTDEIREELQFHVEMRTDEYARHGLDARRGAAGRAATVRQSRGHPGPRLRRARWRRDGDDAPGREVRAAATGPSALISILAGLTLALGIGVSTALFSVIDAALLRPLPYPNPEELVTIDVEETTRDKPSRYAPSMTDIRNWRTLDFDRVARRDGTRQRFRAARRRHRHAAAPDRRRSLRRLSRDVWHDADSRSRHSR